MRTRTALAALCLGSAMTATAVAETPDDGRGRFAMSPVEGGFLRLDKETGAVAMCARKDGAWTCEPIADKAPTTTGKSQLEAENQVLRDRVKSLEESLETGKPQANGEPVPSAKLPTEEEVDKAFDYVERIFKKFRERVQKYEQPAPPALPPSTQQNGGSGAL
jgi:hypothetical protein